MVNPEAEHGVAFLRSLAFSDMQTKATHRDGATGSGEWVLDHEQYKAWVVEGGVLWAQGRVGAGRTMLMDFLVAEQQRETADRQNAAEHRTEESMSTQSSDSSGERAEHSTAVEEDSAAPPPDVDSPAPSIIVLSHFFSSNRGELQRSLLGFYRSILHQLLDKCPEMLAEAVSMTNFIKICETRGQPDWTESYLQDAFEKCVRHYLSDQATIKVFVDGLNESGQEPAKSLIRRLNALCKATGRQVSICVSNTPLSLVGARYLSPEEYDFEIVVEKENDSDVRGYIDDWFDNVDHSMSEKEATKLKVQLHRRTRGVFQWLSSVLKPAGPVAALLETDESMEYVLDNIERLPKDLSIVYEMYIHGIPQNEVHMALRMFECMTLARRPLTIEEFRYAAVLDSLENAGEPCSASHLERSPSFCKSNEVIAKRITRLSKGLVRHNVWIDPGMTAADLAGSNVVGTLPRVFDCLVFDHESVHEFMTPAGLKILEGRLDDPLQPVSLAQRSLRLARRCLAYVQVEEVVSFARNVEILAHKGKYSRTPVTLTMSGAKERPLALWAASQWVDHAGLAERQDNLVGDIAKMLLSVPDALWPLLAKLQSISSCAACAQKIEKHDKSNIFHIICLANLTKTLAFVLQASITGKVERTTPGFDQDPSGRRES